RPGRRSARSRRRGRSRPGAERRGASAPRREGPLLRPRAAVRAADLRTAPRRADRPRAHGPSRLHEEDALGPDRARPRRDRAPRVDVRLRTASAARGRLAPRRLARSLGRRPRALRAPALRQCTPAAPPGDREGPPPDRDRDTPAARWAL